MFRSKTLFIVGAGGSKEAGVPTGAELKLKIAAKIDIRFPDGYIQKSGDDQITEALKAHVRQLTPEEIDINPYLEAAWKMRDALPQALSVDNYIDAHRDDPKVALCGKLGIARVILEAETNSKLYIDLAEPKGKLKYERLDKTWFQSFWQLIVEGVGYPEIETVFNNVAFIIFNYDRCIEHFLVNSLQNYFGVSEDTAAGLMNAVTILHPYGIVGQLPWQDGVANGVPFGQPQGGPRLLDIAGQIKTFTERVQEAAVLAEIRGQVQAAETIVFLGFAFHDINMELLKPSGASKVKRVFATAKGFSTSDCDAITSDINDILQSKKLNKIEVRNGWTCDDLFGENRRTLPRA